MKKNLLFIFSFISASIFAQTFMVGKMTIDFKDASRTGGSAGGATIVVPAGGTGRSVGANLFYPATSAGNATPVANGQFPVVVFGHGFVMAASDYTNVANRLASLGFIVAVARTENEGPIPFPTPSHDNFGLDLSFLANAVQTLNTSTVAAVTMFNGKVTNKSAVGGHSMGGGCSFVAAKSNTALTCLFNFAAATTNNTPNSIGSASLVTVPTLIISGQEDSVADTTVQKDHYIATASSKKFHVVIKGVKHCDFGNGTSGTCTIGQAACSGAGCNTILFNRYMTYLEPFLANQLKNDCGEGNRFMDTINSASPNRVTLRKLGTLACSSIGVTEINLFNEFNLYPNPTTNNVTVSFLSNSNEAISFTVVDVTGKLVLKEVENSYNQKTISKTIMLNDLDKGTYILFVTQGSTKQAHKIIKL